jgi:hypothetical protein
MSSESLVVIDDVEREAESTADQIRYRHRRARIVESRVPFGTAQVMAASLLREFPTLVAAIVDFRLNGAATVRYDGIDLLQALKTAKPNIVGVILTKRPIIDDEPRITQDRHSYDLLWDKRELAGQFPSYMQDLESHIACVTKHIGPTTSVSFAPEDRLYGDQAGDEEQTPLLKRYHELVDKQMLETLSALEKDELDAIKRQLDEIDEGNETLQRAEVQMDARRRLLDEQLEKISGQLKALLEQM